MLTHNTEQHENKIINKHAIKYYLYFQKNKNQYISKLKKVPGVVCIGRNNEQEIKLIQQYR